VLRRLADFAIHRTRFVLLAALAFFIVAGALGGGVAQHLSSGGFNDPAAESTQAANVLAHQFRTGSPNLVLLVTADHGRTVDDPVVSAAATRLTRDLAAQPYVEDVSSYWALGRPAPLRSAPGAPASSALIVARVAGDQSQMVRRSGALATRFTTHVNGASVSAGGQGPVFNDIQRTIEQDLKIAELIALPITVLLLMFIFRGVVAALLPLAIGVLSIVGTFLVLRVLASLTEVSVFALNLTTAMGLGLAIDYSLFVVSRYREELAAGFETHDAIRRTVRTAGRTVAFSATTVAASLCALLVFPVAFLRSFAYAGVAVAALAGLFAVVVLPAMLAGLGHRIDALSFHRRAPKPVGEGAWHRVATFVMRRPVPIVTVVVIGLLFLGSPFRHVNLARPDDRVLYSSAPARQVSDVLRRDFSSREAGALTVVAPDTSGAGTGAAATAAIGRYARSLSLVPGVARVDAVTGVYLHGTVVPVDRSLTARFASTSGTWLSVVPTVEPNSSAGETVARGVRAVAAPFPVLVGGQSAELVDSNRSLIDSLPLALGILAAITFVLLFIMFGSVVIPLKALVLNLLSLTATFGAMVWIFQQGHLSGVLHFTATGNLDATTPILMFCIAFGLSMDYEVFLLSRIKEEHDAGNDNVSAVAVGLERTGRLVTAAAVLISVVFLAFATSRVSFIKLFGLGLALAVLMDAFIIRGTLVPAFMRLAGDANWWAPRWLRRIHDRIGFHEGVDLEEPGPAVPDGPGPVDLRPPDGVDPTLAEAAADSDSGGRVGVR
jgi:RND superfamily putative drug exporter